MDTTELDSVIDDAFSGVVLVRERGDVVFDTARGLASQRWGIPNSLDLRFDTASITKLFTSVAVLQQVEVGALDLEASIHYYVDLADTAIGPDVTLLHLLTHTSGIADDADEEAGEDYAALWANKPTYSVTETRDFLPQFAHKPPLARPGVQCRYCNAGYILAGLAVERASGMGYRDYVREHVFLRARMHDSGFFDRRDAEPRVAEGWDRDADGRWVENIFSYPPIGSPDGGAHATASDLIRFIDAAREGDLLGREFTEEFFLPQVEHDDNVFYGFGLEFDLDDEGGVRSWYKEGINAGSSGIVRSYPDAGVDLVVLSNSEEGAWPVIRELDARI